MASIEAAIAETRRKLQNEHKIRDAAQLMQSKSCNPRVLDELKLNMCETERRITYLKRELHRLENKRRSRAATVSDSANSTGTRVSPISTNGSRSQRSHTVVPSEDSRCQSAILDSQSFLKDLKTMSFQDSSVDLSIDLDNLSLTLDPVDRGSASTSNASSASVERLRSRMSLDMSYFDTPVSGFAETSTPTLAFSTQKISLQLHEIAYKLDVEKKVREASNRLSNVYLRSFGKSDKSKRAQAAQANAHTAECNEKIMLLERAYKKYQGLHIDVLDNDDEAETDGSTAQGRSPLHDNGMGVRRLTPGFRRPISGKLKIKVLSATQLSHGPNSQASACSTFCVIRVDGAVRGQTKANRNAIWFEDFELPVHQAHELEIYVYDRLQKDTLVGMLWMKLADIHGEIKQLQDSTATAPSGWASAAQIASQSDPMAFKRDHMRAPSGHGTQCRWELEPIGQIELAIDFVRDQASTERLRHQPSRLARRANVRKRKEEVKEANGHKFYPRQFYTIMRCALCEEYLVNAKGYQCEDCRYFCHDRCMEKAVVKCVSKTYAEMDPNEDRINHRIPHRFATVTNVGAHWCCHCGSMLSLGRKRALRCRDCGISCHDECRHLVPYFCGIKMSMANQILNEIKRMNHKRPSVQPKRQSMFTTTAPRLLKSASKHLGAASAKATFSGTHSALGERTSSVHSLPTSGTMGRDRSVSAVTMSKSEGSSMVPNSTMRSDSFPSLPPWLEKPSLDLAIPQAPLGFNSTITSPLNQSTQSSFFSSLPRSPDFMPSTHGSTLLYPPGSMDKRSAGSVLAKGEPGKRTTLNDFRFLAVLGKGNFGKVMLSEEKATKNLYAIKVLKKESIIDDGEVLSIHSEKRALQAATRERHPFLVGLHSCFQSDTRLYFVMEYVCGGDLMSHIQKRHYFSEHRARFYAAEVLLALEFLHQKNIVYRDLKLDNILLAADGHIKLADYGLCKEHMGYGAVTNTFCGTLEFMAPEIVLEQAYGRAVDWWAFGVLVYEMLLGTSPFSGATDEDIQDAILDDEVLYPINMSRDAISICQRLLNRDPARRLGGGPTDAEEVKQHAFFRKIDWVAIAAKKISPPYVPQFKSRTDVSNFDQEFTREPAVLTPIDNYLDENEQKEFLNFTYTAEWAGQSHV
ncbi:Serine/threonine kinase [Dimargaris verticillata]|uniref:protein kinase C n=1 Tax=Dimargaris verticillata TaxID=2761393 RepID=A0A9W8BAG6_9FUNG|nr:Serine/threonine kinase [Dimargaris verticillata]